MLPYQLQEMLKIAAETEDAEKIDDAIKMVKILSPKNFFKVDKDGKDVDPAMMNRKFFNMPRSHWTGDFVTSRYEYRHKEQERKTGSQ